jgi:hypothetical protein
MRGMKRGIAGRFGIFAAALFAAGCSSSEVVQKPPAVLGERKDAQGEVIQQIVLDETDTVTTQNFTPEGAHRSATSERKYYWEEKGKPRREISWLNRASAYFENYLPVENSTAWVGAKLYQGAADDVPAVLDSKGQLLAYPNKLFVVVFNADGIVAQQTLHAIWIHTQDEAFRIEPGNRAIIFRSPQGFKRFDIPANTITDLPSNPASFVTDRLP